MGDEFLRGDKAVQDWCHIFAFCFALACVDALVGLGFGRHLGVSAVCFVAASLFYVTGVKWTQIKQIPLPLRKRRSEGKDTPLVVERMPIWKAVHHVAECLHERREDGDAFPKSRDALRQAAIDGKITIWGKKQLALVSASPMFDSCVTAIPQEYWRLHKITGIASEAPINPIYPFTISVDGVTTLAYADLHVDEPQITKVWQAAAPVGRAEWLQLGKDFESCPQQLRAEYSRCGLPGRDTWYIGGWTPSGKCKSLCGLAGTMLLRSPRVCAELSEEIRSAGDPMYRWLDFLKERRPLDNYIALVETLNDGRQAGVYAGYIYSLPEASAAACIECAAKET
jgi:hypothetical protein